MILEIHHKDEVIATIPLPDLYTKDMSFSVRHQSRGDGIEGEELSMFKKYWGSIPRDIERLFAMVCKETGQYPYEVKSSKWSQGPLTTTKYLFCYIARKKYNFPELMVQEFLNYKGNASITHALKSITDTMSANKIFRENVTRIQEKVILN